MTCLAGCVEEFWDFVGECVEALHDEVTADRDVAVILAPFILLALFLLIVVVFWLPHNEPPEQNL